MNKKIPEESLPPKWSQDLLLSLTFAPLCLEWKFGKAKNGDQVYLRAWNEKGSGEFLALYRRDATPQQMALATAQVIALARQQNSLPLLIVPYLKEEQLLELEKQSVNALDLCGNGIITSPGQFYVFRTGLPDRFTSSRPLKNVYRGTSSLVARAFLLCPEYAEISDLYKEIKQRGGEVSLSTLSKVLTELEADLMIQRVRSEQKPQARSLRLLQPEKLLDRLGQEYVAPKIQRTFVGKTALSASGFQEALRLNAERKDARLIATGIGSANRYAALAMENTIYVYTDRIDALLEDLPVVSTTRFPNLSILQTDETTAFFDPRLDESGFPWASPVTSYLEMKVSEERMERSAEQVRARLLKALTEKTEAQS